MHSSDAYYSRENFNEPAGIAVAAMATKGRNDAQEAEMCILGSEGDT